MQLTPGHVQIGIDKELWLITNREKSENAMEVPFLPLAMEIINRYQNEPKAIVQHWLFPNIFNQKLNSYLKEIADICEITKNMISHIEKRVGED